MKLLILSLITALFSLSVFGQASNNSQRSSKNFLEDSLRIEQVPLMNYEIGVAAISKAVEDIPTKYGDEVRQKFLQVFQQLAAQYKQKQQPPNNKPK